MSIERESGEIAFICDGKGCFRFLRTETKDFQEAIEDLKENLWAVRKIKDEWLHICPDCQEAEYALAL